MQIEDVRKSFEKWISSPPFEYDVTRFPDDATKSAWPGSYKNFTVETAWQAWQEGAIGFAALQQDMQGLRAEVERLRDDGQRGWILFRKSRQELTDLRAQLDKWDRMAACANFDKRGLLAVGEELQLRDQQLADLRAELHQTQENRDLLGDNPK